MIFNFLLLLLPVLSFSSVRVVATTTDVAWLVQRIGAGTVEVKTLAKASDNYHFVDARPDFILAVSRADMVCRVGAELEIGWLPKVLERAANPKVLHGASGDCDLSKYVNLEEVPAKVDRSMGDAHIAGNPHYWLSPLAMASASKGVMEYLSKITPEQSALYAKNQAELEKELLSLQKRLQEKLLPLSSRLFLEYHKEFFYFFKAYGLQSLGSVEEIPGVSPSAARIAGVIQTAKEKSVFMVLASPNNPKATLEKIKESAVPFLVLETSLRTPQEKSAYFSWQESLVDTILKAK